MTRRINYLFLALVGVVLTGCFGPTEPVEFKVSDLYRDGGLWLEERADQEHYVRFTDEQGDPGYLYGREWHEEEDVHEKDLLPYGNGWFMYKITHPDLTEIHLMDNDGARIPKVYVITTLTEDRLEYYEKDIEARKFKFNKVVETK